MSSLPDKSHRQYGDAFEFWWGGVSSFPAIDASWAARKQIAWEAWKASAARSTETTPAETPQATISAPGMSSDSELLKMALRNTAACLGDALALYNKVAGYEAFKNSSAPSAKKETAALEEIYRLSVVTSGIPTTEGLRRVHEIARPFVGPDVYGKPSASTDGEAA